MPPRRVAILETSAVTAFPPPAQHALIAGYIFKPGEVFLGRAAHQLSERRFHNITHPAGIINEEIAAERVPIMLDHHVITARFVEGAVGMMAVHDIVEQ